MGFSDTDDMAPAQTLELTKEDLVAGSASVLKFVKFQRVTGLSVRCALLFVINFFERTFTLLLTASWERYQVPRKPCAVSYLFHDGVGLSVISLVETIRARQQNNCANEVLIVKNRFSSPTTTVRSKAACRACGFTGLPWRRPRWGTSRRSKSESEGPGPEDESHCLHTDAGTKRQRPLFGLANPELRPTATAISETKRSMTTIL